MILLLQAKALLFNRLCAFWLKNLQALVAYMVRE